MKKFRLLALLGAMALVITFGAARSAFLYWTWTGYAGTTNVSTDSAYVKGTNLDTTGWFPLMGAPVHTVTGDVVKPYTLADSQFVTLKTKAVRTGTGTTSDSCEISVLIQTSEDQSTVSSTKSIATIAEPIAVNTTEYVGFGWRPLADLDEGTPVATWARFIFDGTDATDSVKISNMYIRNFGTQAR